MKFNNSNNIYKMTNHHSVQRNEHIERPRHMMLEFQILAWDRHKNETGLNQFMRSQPSPLGKWISNGNTYIHKRYKTTCTNSLPLKENTHYHKNEWQHKHGQYNSRVNECLYLTVFVCLWLLRIILSETCFEEMLPEGVYRTNTGNLVKVIATFACQDGFTYVGGNESRECYINGSWSGKMLNCTS
jgi:glucan-binding YG repeat protein